MRVSNRFGALLPWLLLAGALVALAMLRTVENLSEYDRYPDAADNILRGELRFDDFHGFGLPMAIAGLSALLGISTFRCGLLIAAASALLLVWATSRLAATMLPGAEKLAVWLIGGNALVWTMGATVSADMPAAGLLLAGFALALRARPPESARRIAMIGILLGAAVAVHPAIVTTALPVAMLAAWRCRGPWRLLTLGAALLVGYLPHLLPCVLTGRPLFGSSWHNLYLKVVCNWDTALLKQAQDAGTLPDAGTFFAEHGVSVAIRGLQDCVRGVTQVLPEMMVGSATPVPGIAWWLPALAITMLLWTPALRRKAPLLVLFFLLQFGGVCFTHHPITRHLVPSLAVLVVGLAVGLEAFRRRFRAGVVLAWIVILSTIAIGRLQVVRFLATQPAREVEVARTLPQRLTRPVSVLASYNLLDHYVEYPCRALPYRNATAYDSASRSWETLREDLRRSGMSVLLIGRTTASALFAAIAGSPPPKDFVVVHEDAEVFAIEHRHVETDWIARTEISPRPARRGMACEIRLRLAAVAETADIVSVGAAVSGPDGAQKILTLSPRAGSGSGIYGAEFRPETVGTWNLQPVILRRDGEVLRGADLPFAVIQ